MNFSKLLLHEDNNQNKNINDFVILDSSNLQLHYFKSPKELKSFSLILSEISDDVNLKLTSKTFNIFYEGESIEDFFKKKKQKIKNLKFKKICFDKKNKIFCFQIDNLIFLHILKVNLDPNSSNNLSFFNLGSDPNKNILQFKFLNFAGRC